MKLRILRLEDYAGLLVVSPMSSKSSLLIRRGKRVGKQGKMIMEAEVRETPEDATLLALVIGEKATSQRMQVASRIWERQGNGFL